MLRTFLPHATRALAFDLLFITSVSPDTLYADEPNMGGGPAPFDAHASDLSPEQIAAIQLRVQDNTTYASWNQTFNAYYAASYWYWWYTLPSNEATGTWKFRVNHDGQTVDQPFTICNTKPLKPVLQTPANGATVNAKVALDWSDTDCATYYKVKVHEGSKTGAVRFSKNSLTASQVTARKLTHGKTHYWRAGACNSFGCTYTKWRTMIVN